MDSSTVQTDKNCSSARLPNIPGITQGSSSFFFCLTVPLSLSHSIHIISHLRISHFLRLPTTLIIISAAFVVAAGTDKVKFFFGFFFFFLMSEDSWNFLHLFIYLFIYFCIGQSRAENFRLLYHLLQQRKFCFIRIFFFFGHLTFWKVYSNLEIDSLFGHSFHPVWIYVKKRKNIP